jgi:hypothetical protein
LARSHETTLAHLRSRLLWRCHLVLFGQRQSKPPAEIAALEVARGDIARTPSCYSLDSVLTANRLDGSASDASVFWTTRVRDEWTMTVKRGKSWSRYTFVKEGDVMTPVGLSFSDDLPQDTRMEKAIGDLLAATNGSVLPMARCRGG